MSPRPRQRRVLPNGIKPDALPTYVYWDPTGHGRWIWKPYDASTKKCKAIRLAGPAATLREIWDAYERLSREPPTQTLKALVELFEASPAWKDLAPATQHDYHRCAEMIQAAKTKSGLQVAESRLTDWTPGAVRAYVDKRGEKARSRATTSCVICDVSSAGRLSAI